MALRVTKESKPRVKFMLPEAVRASSREGWAEPTPEFKLDGAERKDAEEKRALEQVVRWPQAPAGASLRDARLGWFRREKDRDES